MTTENHDLRQMSAMTALNSMMSGRFFDICTIDSVGKMMGVRPEGEAYNILRPLHCIHWEKMPDELRDAVPDLIRQCLGVGPSYVFKTLTQEVIDVTPARKLLRLFGGKQ